MNVANRTARQCHKLARKLGGRVERETGGVGHPHLLVIYGNKSRRITIAGTPSDIDVSIKQAMKRVEDAIKEMRASDALDELLAQNGERVG